MIREKLGKRKQRRVLGPKTQQILQAVTVPPEDDSRFELVEDDRFKLISDWYHFAILSLADVRGSRWQKQWLAARLGISRTEAAEAMLRLKRFTVIAEIQDPPRLCPTYLAAIEHRRGK
jgi:hypothetical protein